MATLDRSRLARLGLWLDTDSSRGVRRVIRSTRSRPGYGTVDVDAAVIRYREHGSGSRVYVFAADPPIVLEHYDRLLAALSPHGRTIVLELPGFGFSPVRPGFDFSFERVTGVMERALSELGVADATLCFPCGSAYLGLALAAKKRSLVRNLILAQAPSFGEILAWKRGRDPKGVLGRPFIGQCAMRVLKKSRAPRWFAVSVGKRSELGWLQSIAEAKLAEGARWSLASAFQALLVEGNAPPPAPCPILALWGRQDRSHAATNRESSRELGADVRLVEWSDVGHFPELEEPERFARLAADASV